MPANDWTRVLAGLSPHRPVDLDGDDTSAAPPGRLSGERRPPSSRLFPMESERAGIGVRIREPLADPVAIAARLAAIASERDLSLVILSDLPRCGLERWGFRVERIAGPDEATRSAQVQEIAAFWGIAVIVEAAEIPLLR